MADASLQILAAMITPAVLISGAGTMLMSTATRVGRATDRIRQLSDRFKVLATEEGSRSPLSQQEKELIKRQLLDLAQRSRLLVRAMTSIYYAVALLVLSSLLIGTDHVIPGGFGRLPLFAALLGAAALSFGALTLSFEIRLSARTTREEMNYLLHLGEYYAKVYEEKT